jgi:hypothetical protein
MTIRFDAERAIVAFEKHLVARMAVIQAELLIDAQSIMLTQEGAKDLHTDAIKVTAGVIIARILGGPWAIMDEWGTGSWMDRKNPRLNEYRRSNMWNPARDTAAIMTRPNQPGQINIFGESVNGRGAGGVDLERLAKAGKADGKYLPQAPSHAVQTAFRWMRQGEFRRHLNMAIRTFPWSRYLIVRNTKG